MSIITSHTLPCFSFNSLTSISIVIVDNKEPLNTCHFDNNEWSNNWNNNSNIYILSTTTSEETYEETYEEGYGRFSKEEKRRKETYWEEGYYEEETNYEEEEDNNKEEDSNNDKQTDTQTQTHTQTPTALTATLRLKRGGGIIDNIKNNIKNNINPTNTDTSTINENKNDKKNKKRPQSKSVSTQKTILPWYISPPPNSKQTIKWKGTLRYADTGRYICNILGTSQTTSSTSTSSSTQSSTTNHGTQKESPHSPPPSSHVLTRNHCFKYCDKSNSPLKVYHPTNGCNPSPPSLDDSKNKKKRKERGVQVMAGGIEDSYTRYETKVIYTHTPDKVSKVSKVSKVTSSNLSPKDDFTGTSYLNYTSVNGVRGTTLKGLWSLNEGDLDIEYRVWDGVYNKVEETRKRKWVEFGKTQHPRNVVYNERYERGGGGEVRYKRYGDCPWWCGGRGSKCVIDLKGVVDYDKGKLIGSEEKDDEVRVLGEGVSSSVPRKIRGKGGGWEGIRNKTEGAIKFALGLVRIQV
jgi:hypothetical protein